VSSEYGDGEGHTRFDLIDVVKMPVLGYCGEPIPAALKAGISVNAAEGEAVADVTAGTFLRFRFRLFWGIVDSSIGERKSGALVRFLAK